MGILNWLNRRRPVELDEEDFKKEIEAHLAIAAGEKRSDGVDEADARYAALREFGNLTRTTEAARSVWTPRWLEALRDLASDVRYAIRSLAKQKAFSLTVIGVLTLGIGLNAAVFTMLKAIALSPVAGVKDSGRLEVLYRETTSRRPLRVSYPDYVYLRDHDTAFTGLAGSIVTRVGLGRDVHSRSLFSEIVSGNYFQVLGVRARLGRTLLPSDEVVPGGHPVVVISDALWRRDFSADPGVVGTTIRLNNVPLTVVGVADAAFHGTIVSYDVEAFIPVMMAPQLGFTFGTQRTPPSEILNDRRAGVFYPQGFLRPGVSRAAAAAQSQGLWAALALERPQADEGETLRTVPFSRAPDTGQSFFLPVLIVLSAMGLLVLTIACANIAGLVLVRGVSRRGEIAMRLALGASRARIVRLLIVENVVIALPGAAFGILLAANGIPVLLGYIEWLMAPQRMFINLNVDSLVIAFAACAACGCALVFGFVPALQGSRIDLVAVINSDASPRGAARGRLRASLVVAQVAVSLLLLVGASLVTRSLDAARRVSPGFDPAHVASIQVDLKQNGYDQARGRLFYRRLLDAVRADGAIESASIANYNPVNFFDTGRQRIAIDGYEPRRDEDLSFLTNAIGSDHFRTLRIGLRPGRAFDERDDEKAAPVAIVNNTLAERFWGSAANAIGRRIRVADGDWRTVIGVAADVKYVRINESPRPYVYLPFLQAYRPAMVLNARASAALVAAGVSDEAIVERVRAHIAALDANLPLAIAEPMARHITGSLILFNFTATILFIFGVAGMALAALGTYGLVSYTVKQSTHEIGIRMALGAARVSVVTGFLTRGLKLGAIGAGIGVAAALVLSRFLQGLLFGVSATDAASFSGASAIVLGGVLLATLVPAWRAARINPLTALRHQ
jgi:putative ABC transport system permease protein